ncbi:MAG: hypothetical protein ACKVGW_18955, partial [Verrucomicrobiia bacterium]
MKLSAKFYSQRSKGSDRSPVGRLAEATFQSKRRGSDPPYSQSIPKAIILLLAFTTSTFLHAAETLDWEALPPLPSELGVAG